MYPSHHIEDDMLLGYAAGTLGHAASVGVATHLSYCPQCRAAVAAAECVGGAFLEEIAPAPLSNDLRARAFDRLDEVEPATQPPAPRTISGARMPRPVLDSLPNDLRWKWVSPGIKYAEMLTDEGGVRVGLMLGQPGAPITPHGHSGDEVTIVLGGGYHDGAVGFRPGDAQCVDENTVHEIQTDADGACLSLVMDSGPIKPTRLIARILRYFTPF